MLFKVNVNGVHIATVKSESVPTLEQTIEVLAKEGWNVSDKDAVTCQMVNETEEELPKNLIPFRANAFMQTENLAIAAHFRNLLLTFGREQVLKALERNFEIEIKDKKAA